MQVKINANQWQKYFIPDGHFLVGDKHYSLNVQKTYPGWFLRLHVNKDDLGNDTADTLCHLQCNSSV